jgi:hypothetical protein
MNPQNWAPFGRDFVEDQSMTLALPSSQRFYHGTAPENVERIRQEGFRIRIFVEEDGSRWPATGLLGAGVYITSNWRQALFFGRALLRVALRRGTRILDMRPKPDGKILDALSREFGAPMLARNAPVRKLIPANKHLTTRELVELTRYHYQRTWEQKKHHDVALDHCISLLRRYKFDGYGHPENDMGIVILDPSRVLFRQLVAVAPEPTATTCQSPEFSTIGELEAYFAQKGEQTHQQLAGQIQAQTN